MQGEGIVLQTFVYYMGELGWGKLHCKYGSIPIRWLGASFLKVSTSANSHLHGGKILPPVMRELLLLLLLLLLLELLLLLLVHNLVWRPVLLEVVSVP